MKFNSNFPILSTIAFILFYSGLLGMILGIPALLNAFNDLPQGIGFLLIFLGLCFMAFAEIIGVLFAIELNTRRHWRLDQKKVIQSKKEDKSKGKILTNSIEENDTTEIDVSYKEDLEGDAFKCLKCGTIIPEDQNKCPKCGWSFNGSHF